MCNAQGILHYCSVVYQLTFIKSEIQIISIFQINIVHTCNWYIILHSIFHSDFIAL